MVLVLPKVPSFGEEFGRAIGQGAGAGLMSGLEARQSKKKLAEENEAIKRELGINLTGITDPDARKAYVSEQLKRGSQQQQQSLARFEDEKSYGMIKDTFGQKFADLWQHSPTGGRTELVKQGLEALLRGENLDQRLSGVKIPESQEQSIPSPEKESIESIVDIEDPSLYAGMTPKEKAKAKHQFRIQNIKSKEAEKKFHSEYSKEPVKEANQFRATLPKKEMALDFARNAIESENLSYFSPDKLADATGIDLFRTSKGAQLITAGKENLLSNMSRVSARSQNLWFEQRLNSMFAKIGQSKEANLTVLEMLEGEVELDKAYLKEFDRLSEEDTQRYGVERKDIAKRAQDAIKPLGKEILKRTSYRMKEIEENEKGLSSLKAQVGKNVIKGTPLTLSMAKLYKDKFGKNGLEVAKKNGYYIPSLEEFKIFQMRPQEMREQE